MKTIRSILFCVLVVSVNYSVVCASDGTAKGETTDEPGQEGLGLELESRSSNVIRGQIEA